MRPDATALEDYPIAGGGTEPLRLVVLHRGEPPALAADPWASATEPRVLQLARAIASSDGWPGRAPASLAVRTTGDPLIAAVGRFGDADLAWLGGASRQLATTLVRVIVLDHAGAESAAERCLKRRGRPALEVQHMEDAFGRLRPRLDVIVAGAEGGVVLGRGDTAASFVLEAVAADMWRALAATGERGAAARRLASVYDVDEALLAEDLNAFVADLREAGLLAAEPA